MKPTDILCQEHRVIEQVLNCLEKMAQRCRDGGVLDVPPAREALDFFRNFADRCHHGKEEAHLFPAMEARGFSRDCGPTAVMLREHELGRVYVRQMGEALEAAADDPQAKSRFVENALNYIQLLREHIRKEDHCLFPMADKTCDETEQNRLSAAFQHLEHEEMGAGAHEKFHRLADDLARRFGVPQAEPAPPTGECGCGH
jgi:hemerythrin-like domain-containing protein